MPGAAPGCLLAGMANLHSHAHQRAMAGLAERSGHDPDSFWTWRTTMYRFLDAMTPDQLQAVAAQLYVEMLKSGSSRESRHQQPVLRNLVSCVWHVPCVSHGALLTEKM